MKISNKYKNAYFFDKLSQRDELNNRILKFKNKLKNNKNIKQKFAHQLLVNFKKKYKNIQ
jgi:hypothetical protein